MTQKITAKIASLRNDEPYFSLEFFPPKTRIGFANLTARLERMSQALHPLFVTVTWGAGGTTANKSLELAEICQRQLSLTTVLHLTCTNSSRKLIDEALEAAKSIGIRNILALRGDPPRSEEYVVGEEEGGDDSNTEFRYAVDLVRYIRAKYGDWFDIGVAAYPEGHADESHPEGNDALKDLPYLIEKVQAGADFIMTQLTYDVDAYNKFEKMLRVHESGVFKSIPIIPGLMPIQSYNNLTRVTKLSHVHVSEEILEKLKAVRADDEMVKKIGVDLLCDIIKGIQEGGAQAGPRGFHFYTLNLEKSVTKILERCNLLRQENGHQEQRLNGTTEGLAIEAATSQNQVILDHPDTNRSAQTLETTASSIALTTLTPTTQQDTLLQISEGVGSLGREATWDDFPNGRWGDPRSPAFGEIDGYGPSLHVGPNEARKLWGYPVDENDISSLFLRHIRGELSVVPWSEGGGGDLQEVEGEASPALSPETAVIREELIELIEKRGWWTLASQPAVNGVRSSDKIFGWGPPGEGFVFQKAFVEFFSPKQSYETVLKPLLKQYAGEEEITWFAVNAAGEFTSSSNLTSQPQSPSSSPLSPSKRNSHNSNAVTWGVFRGKEIITPTIIEEDSFKAWGEEAFRIWDEWRRVFPKGSATEKFLGKMKEEAYLVCVVGQRFGAGTESEEEEEREKRSLWRILAGKDTN